MRKTRRHWGIDTFMKPMKRSADLADNICLKAPRDETLSSKVNVIAQKEYRSNDLALWLHYLLSP
ncbi:hypothetical protein FXE49_02225 [Vibrio cholerae]|uniref:Uncharacterized protein n=1 Tax=Vibrio cholerae TaxID=666 RepID=A0ABD7SFZ3_VIBCL|nr:hypothetical protein FXF03_18400 [Vibrio cholerae]TXZ84047.1 hypothetical protein FXE49_02225 [Vibrio cholerae]